MLVLSALSITACHPEEPLHSPAFGILGRLAGLV